MNVQMNGALDWVFPHSATRGAPDCVPRAATLMSIIMKVHEIMTAHARCVAPGNTLVEAAGLMRHLDVGVLPVCDNERLAGMVTDRDIVLRGVADGRNANTTTVREVMSPGVFYVFAEQEVEEAARLMEEKQIRRVPVLNRQKRLVGIVSLGDIAVTSHPAFSGQALREVSESPEEHMRDGRTYGSVQRHQASERMRVGAPGGARRRPGGSRKTGNGGKGRKMTGSARGKRVSERANGRTRKSRRGLSATRGRTSSSSGAGSSSKSRNGSKKTGARARRQAAR
jgi:CBS domain-containing protein